MVDTFVAMLGSISRGVVGRRSRWVVIAVWLVLALGARLAAAQAPDARPPTRARRSARAAPSRTQVHDLLNARFPEGRWSTSVDRLRGAHGLDLRAGTASSPRLLDKICGTADAAGPRRRRRRRAASLRRARATRSRPQTRRRRSRPTTTADDGADARSSTARTTPSRSCATSPRCARSSRGPTAARWRSYVTGQAGFDADRALAVEGIDGTLLAITGVLVLVLMLLTYRSPLIAGADARRGGRSPTWSPPGCVYGLVRGRRDARSAASRRRS